MIPIACSLTAEDLTDRAAAWRKLLTTSAVAVERVPGGIRLSVHAGSANSLRELVALEQACCPWISASLDRSTVVFTAEGAGETVIRDMFASLLAVDT